MKTDRLGSEVLEEDECFRLLSASTLGRVGLTANALPLILPVNFAVCDRSIVFRTIAGTKLAAVAAGQVLCFEADSLDNGSGEGWSVVILGRGDEMTTDEELEAARQLPLDSWLPHTDHYVRISAELVSGRRIKRP